MKKNKDKTLTSSEKLAARTEGFFSRNYRLLAIIGVIIVLICIVAAVLTVVGGNNREAKADAVFALEQHYNSLLLLDPASADYTSASSQLVSDAESILVQSSADEYAALKANYILGLYYFDEENWADAQAAFEAVAENGSGTYLGSLALANAAASAENNGDPDTALVYYNRIWDDYGTQAPESPKALFNAARIYESQGDAELAAATYHQLADEFVSSEYAQLASSRLLVLENN